MLRRKYRYDVSFSFAEEDCAFVQDVANHLKSRGSAYRYYFYKDDVVSTWGKDLKEHLSLVYKRQSRLCVVFVSAAYREKLWTRFELEKAQIKAKREIHEYILQFKMDDTELPGIPSSIKYLLVKDFDANGLADAICTKVDEHKVRDRFPVWLYWRMRYYLKSPRHLVTLAILGISICGFLLRDHLTPVSALAKRLQKQHTRRYRALCKDGTLSQSIGRGTCSHHLGIRETIDTLIPVKTIAEYQNEAKTISWLDE